MVNWHSFNGIKSRPDELILLYAFVPSQSAILTFLCISEWQEHVQIFTLVIQGYKWQNTGEVLADMLVWYSWVSRTVSPSWCLALPLPPWCQWSLGHRLSVCHYSALWTRRLYFIMFVFHVEMWSEETFPSLREWTTEQAEHCALWKDRRTKDFYSHQLIFPWCDW